MQISEFDIQFNGWILRAIPLPLSTTEKASMENVVLVNEQDEPIGLMEKMEAHEKALLHRAFSVFVMNKEGEMLLQRRALSKYHSPGLWTNTACSHPRQNELPIEAAHRRLEEEMGFDCDIKKAFHFIYKAPFDNGLTEHELDHVFIGEWSGDPTPNAEEVGEWRYISLPDLEKEVAERPEDFTIWFRIALPRVLEHLAAKEES